MRQRKNGIAIGTVLVSMTTFVTILFLAVSASLSHLNMVGQSEKREHAANLADAALDAAIERMGDTDFDFGKLPTDRVQVAVQGLNDAEGIVTFAPAELPDGYSTFNLESDSSVAGSASRTVPPRTSHLVARGRVGEVEAWKEAIVHVPAFPDGLIASGAVDASGLLLMGVKSETQYSGGDPRSIPPINQLPVNLFSNATTGVTVDLDNSSHVSGSVGSPGTINISPDTHVAGEIRPGAGSRPLPNVDVADRIRLLSSQALPVGPSTGNLQLHDNWFNHAAGGLTVSGDLDLNGAALTVNGPLQVSGSIKGRGVILVDGDITVGQGGSAVSSLDQVAIGATGDVTLRASSPDTNYFQGLVYTEGNFQASDITIVGTMVVNGKNGSAGSVSLDNVRFVYTPRSVTTALSPPVGTTIRGHSTALSIVVTKNQDNTFQVDARLYVSNDGQSGGTNTNNPISWSTFQEQYGERSWLGENVGPVSPTMGDDLGRRMGDYADSVETSGGTLGLGGGTDKVYWRKHLEAEVPRIINELLVQPNSTQVVSFNLNNVLTHSNDQARVLLRRNLIR